MAETPLTPVPLQKMVGGFWASKTLSVATELGIFTRIAQGARTLEELSSKLNVMPRPLEMLLNACCALELLKKDGNIYENNPLADKFLVKGKPGYFGDVIIWFGTTLYDTWGRLKDSIESNKSQEEHEKDLFKKDPKIAAKMTRAMHSLAIGPALALAKGFDFSRYSKLLDLGGGSGAYSIIIAKHHPNIHAIVQDLPSVLEVAQDLIRKSELESRVSTLAGDFFEIGLPKTDVVLIGQVLHSYNEKDCKGILRKVNGSLTSEGKVIVVEFMLNDEKTGPVFPALFSLNMLLRSDEGRSYSEGELNSFLSETGFSNIETLDLAGPAKAIIGQKL